ncbi:RidA family protein [Vannielia litorea]|uniref:Enamine deaminase RidA, house cleaning of reactive enamine intermediates, YjgF/YER057c/UK114 family n=1 Tax=Vannielia litorea TaxID=1217970 RepID=A0A1N6G0G2_9RHOB|nr:RidA family protein [Vannielia litorea]SIO00932.1 Enamine deaminase RidA, house cleaning of reactive enamine intermediates, YjgF/YER057c/UK114 family [Vannielia litorea]
MTPSLTRLNPAAMPDSSALGYSQISLVEPGRMAFVSGQVAALPGGDPVPEGLAAQTRAAVANCAAALAALGAAPADIAMLRLYVVGLDGAAMGECYPVVLEWLAGAAPSITGIGVAALAGPDLLIEIEMVVRVPG